VKTPDILRAYAREIPGKRKREVPIPHDDSEFMMLLLSIAVIFVIMILLSMPIVFSLGVAGVAGLFIGGYPLQQWPSALVSGSQSWVLLAIPAFVFAGGLMERCGMSHALVEFARALVGWVKGGLGMSVIVVAYFFSDICGSKMAEVSALGSSLMPPLTKAGYRKADSASMIAAGTAMGMLVPPAIFMIVIAQVTNTSAVTLFLAGFIPAFVMMICLMVLVYLRARKYDWPVDAKPSLRRIGRAGLEAAVPLVVPIVILGGFFFGVITATEAGAVVAGYAVLAAKLYYKNVSWSEMADIAYESAILTGAVVFLLAVASIFQYLMGVQGVPKLLGELLGPLKGHPWAFLFVTAFISMLFGMILEGLPAAVVLIPVVFPIAEAMGIDPIHFNIVQTAAVGIGLFLPPMGVGLLMALKFANISVSEHFPTYVPYICALLVGLTLIICIPEISLTLPRWAGLIK
jgi:tripartite ATP-independent transporter DctM subunit